MVKTKRFAYDILNTYLNACESKFKYAYENGCTTISGTRKVGKTILMRQLVSAFPERSVYKDCSTLGEDFDFEGYFEKLYNQGIRRVFLDEVCKIDSELIADFVSSVKYYSASMLIIITGSVKVSVTRLSNMIGRGLVLELPPITYTERLQWEGVQTSPEYFEQYLKTGTITVGMQDSETYWRKYVGAVVEDTLGSYLQRTTLEGYLTFPDTDKIMKALKYISLCQFVYKTKSGRLVDIPALPKKIKLSISDFKDLKVRYGLTNEEIVIVCDILVVSGLARRITSINEEELSRISGGRLNTLHTVDSNVPALIFEYPWFASYVITSELSDCDNLIDIWLENELMLKMTYLYRYVDKYRTADMEEIDIVYTIGDRLTSSLAGLECKNKSATNISGSNISSYLTIKDRLNLCDLVITSNDKTILHDEYKIVRNDLVVLALEREYFSKCNALFNGHSSYVFCDKIVSELL